MPRSQYATSIRCDRKLIASVVNKTKLSEQMSAISRKWSHECQSKWVSWFDMNIEHERHPLTPVICYTQSSNRVNWNSYCKQWYHPYVFILNMFLFSFRSPTWKMHVRNKNLTRFERKRIRVSTGSIWDVFPLPKSSWWLRIKFISIKIFNFTKSNQWPNVANHAQINNMPLLSTAANTFCFSQTSNAARRKRRRKKKIHRRISVSPSLIPCQLPHTWMTRQQRPHLCGFVEWKLKTKIDFRRCSIPAHRIRQKSEFHPLNDMQHFLFHIWICRFGWNSNVQRVNFVSFNNRTQPKTNEFFGCS